MTSMVGELEAAQASTDVQSIYRDIQQVLRFSDVPWLFRALGAYPGFLRAAWTAIKPTITDFFEASADHVRETAISEIGLALPGNDLLARLKKQGVKEGTLEIITEHLLAHHYVSPKMLLINRAISESLAERPASVNSIVVFPTGRGIPVGMPKIIRIDSASAAVKTRDTLQDSAKLHNLPTATDLVLTLALWPDVLSTAWEHLRPAIEARSYPGVREKILESCSESVQHLRRRMDLGREELSLLGVGEAERSEAVKIAGLAEKYYLASTTDASYLVLSLAGPDVASLSGAALLHRWALPRKSE